jgi:hypothetical protein
MVSYHMRMTEQLKENSKTTTCMDTLVIDSLITIIMRKNTLKDSSQGNQLEFKRMVINSKDNMRITLKWVSLL